MNINSTTKCYVTYFTEFKQDINPSIPLCQREFCDERVDELFNSLCNYFTSENDILDLGLLKVCHCNSNNKYYLLDGQHRFKAYQIFYNKFNMKFNIHYTVNQCNSEDEVRQYFFAINNNFNGGEFVYIEEDSIIKEKIKSHVRKKYPKHISNCISPRFPNINLDKFTNILIEKLQGNTDVDDIIDKIECFNLHIKKQFEENDTNRYEQCMKKNGFFLAYWFCPCPIKKIPQCLRIKVWTTEFHEEAQGKCLVCLSNISLYNFDCGHIISRKNGGLTNLSNLKPICRVCNLSMSTQDMNEFKELFF
jgi:5-methylcytosine-specific restriction endonuclease McrA